jgi:fumarate hydratase class II
VTGSALDQHERQQVIANRCSQYLGEFERPKDHSSHDHVNKGQSSNAPDSDPYRRSFDLGERILFPLSLHDELLLRTPGNFIPVRKTGRNAHLMDATPISLGMN